MANIKVTVDYPISDGTKLRFRTPCESTEVESLVVRCPAENGVGNVLKSFVFMDAHGTELSGVGNVFASDVIIGVMLDVTKGRAYIKNADTNSYIEDIKGTVKRMDEERKEIFANAGRVVEECKDATKDANYSAQIAKGAAAGVVTIEQNTQDELRFWVGTEEEYQEKKDTLEKNVFCIIKDDKTEEEILAATEAATQTSQEALNKVNELSEEVNATTQDVGDINLKVNSLEKDVVKRRVIYQGEAVTTDVRTYLQTSKTVPDIVYVVATLPTGDFTRKLLFNIWYDNITESTLWFLGTIGETKYHIGLHYMESVVGRVINSFTFKATNNAGEVVDASVTEIECFCVGSGGSSLLE